MKRYEGGKLVSQGVYLNLSNWEFSQLYGENFVLPGNSEIKYVKVPAALAVIMGPFAGLAFIIFLPFIGIIGLVSFIAYKVGWWALALGHKVLQPIMISWKPGRAYLTRKGIPGGKKTEEPKGESESTGITQIEEEIAKRRQQGER